MTEKKILEQEERERRRKELWLEKHPILHFFNRLRLKWGRLPPDD